MSVRQNNASNATTITAAAPTPMVDMTEASQETALAEGSSYNVVSSDAPLKRNVVVSIKSTLNDLCLQKQRGTWSPSAEALRGIFQQRKFTDLSGAAEAQGDLSSVVLHSLKVTHVRSSFPIALGAKISCVDDATFSSTGEPFSTVLLPETESNRIKELQADDTSLTYEFARKFPGYTASNLDSKGVHEVAQRRFVLVAADHPIVSAIQENADKLQMGEISLIGLVKISSSLYESIMPLVKSQVSSQIKVRDLSKAMVAIQPAESSNWSAARADLIVDAKRPLKAQLAAELSACNTDEESADVRARFEAAERDLEHAIDHKPLEANLEPFDIAFVSRIDSVLSIQLELSYQFLSK